MNAPLNLVDSPVTPSAARLTVRLVEGQSAAVAVQATDPLKLLVSTPRGKCVWAYATTYGGGLLAGDRVDLQVAVEAGSRLFLSTQSSTKIYRSDDGRQAEQQLTVRVGDQALLVVLPDPVTPFAGARFSQRQTVEVVSSASVLWCDGLTAGRAACAERWLFSSYQSRLDLFVDGVPRLREAVQLSAGIRSIAERCGGAGAFATLVIGGPLLQRLISAVAHAINAQPLEQRPLMSMSPLTQWGIVVRVAAGDRASLDQTLRRVLLIAGPGGLPELLGDDPWQRRS